MKIRDVTAGDAAEVAALLSELGYPVPADAIPSRLEQVHDEDGAAFVAIGDAGEALGVIVLAAHAVLHAAGPVAMITALVVSTAARGQGVGRALVDRAKYWARARGCGRLIVTSGEQRADAHAFYPACGLPYTGRRFGVTLA
jgi:GNAT superfamily N-acetyltransferase